MFDRNEENNFSIITYTNQQENFSLIDIFYVVSINTS